MGIVSTTIEAIVNGLTTTTTYVRASKLEEANLKLPQTDLSDPIGLYYDLTPITTEITEGGTIEVHTVKIAFLKKSEPDNTAAQEDALRDTCQSLAQEFYQSLVTSYSGVFEKFQGYQLDPATLGEKKFAEIMTGYTLTTEIRYLATCSAVSIVGTLLNSENTTINTLNPGQTKSQPDITVTQADDTTATHPSDKDLDVDDFQGAVVSLDTSLLAMFGTNNLQVTGGSLISTVAAETLSCTIIGFWVANDDTLASYLYNNQNTTGADGGIGIYLTPAGNPGFWVRAGDVGQCSVLALQQGYFSLSITWDADGGANNLTFTDNVASDSETVTVGSRATGGAFDAFVGGQALNGVALDNGNYIDLISWYSNSGQKGEHQYSITNGWTDEIGVLDLTVNGTLKTRKLVQENW